MKTDSSFNESEDVSFRHAAGREPKPVDVTQELDPTLEPLQRTYEVLKGALRGIYEAQNDIWASKRKQDEWDVLEARRRYETLRPEIDDAIVTLKAGVETLNREILRIGERIIDDPKSRCRLMRKQEAIAKSFLGNKYLLGEDAFKILELPGGPVFTRKEMPTFATKEEAMAFYEGKRKEKEQKKKKWDRPHQRSENTGLYIDLRVEWYEEKGITDETAKEKSHNALAGFDAEPFYGEIPPGFTEFSDRGLNGDVLVYDGHKLRVCNKSDVDLSKHIRLPDGWERAAKITQ